MGTGGEHKKPEDMYLGGEQPNLVLLQQQQIKYTEKYK